LRDHGPTHHLNRELFNSTRSAEVIHAIADLQQRYPHDKNFLAGFSLGGNFSLRIALHGAEKNIQLNKVVAVCPVIDPAKTTRTLTDGWWVYHKYFVHKWQSSLAKKLIHFPALGYGEILPNLTTLDAMNDYFVPNFTPYASVADYFAGYAIDKDTLKNLQTPCHLIATEDDPVITIQDLDSINKPNALTIEIQQHGGHCGFINNYRLDSWIDNRLVQLFNEAAA
jgi:predicted alpha/beta-fold hydrolase